MSKLQDAVETLSLHSESGLRLRDFAGEIRLVINAIMACLATSAAELAGFTWATRTQK